MVRGIGRTLQTRGVKLTRTRDGVGVDVEFSGNVFGRKAHGGHKTKFCEDAQQRLAPNGRRRHGSTPGHSGSVVQLEVQEGRRGKITRVGHDQLGHDDVSQQSTDKLGDIDVELTSFVTIDVEKGNDIIRQGDETKHTESGDDNPNTLFRRVGSSMDGGFPWDDMAD